MTIMTERAIPKDAPITDNGWMGFICSECGTPMAVHRASQAKGTERSTRGWRVACTGCGVSEYHELGTEMIRITTSR